jgi:hypothetical protein
VSFSDFGWVDLACKRLTERLCAFIDIWPDHMAVPPSLIARRTLKPPKHRQTSLKTAQLRELWGAAMTIKRKANS